MHFAKNSLHSVQCRLHKIKSTVLNIHCGKKINSTHCHTVEKIDTIYICNRNLTTFIHKRNSGSYSPILHLGICIENKYEG